MSDKQTALRELDEGFEQLWQAVQGLDAEQMERRWYDGWGVKEIIAHVAGWERELGAALRRMARGERPTPEGVDYTKTDEWNEKFALEAAPISPQTVLANWRQYHMNFRRAVEALPDDRFGTKEDGSPTTASRIVAGSGYDHYKEHLGPILEWRKKEGL
jgi:hypothetical protein